MGLPLILAFSLARAPQEKIQTWLYAAVESKKLERITNLDEVNKYFVDTFRPQGLCVMS
jgi:hypothetical protein